MVVIIFITNLILVLGLIAYKVFIIINVQELRAFEEDGFTFLRYFPTAPIVSLGCLERLYSLTHPVTRPFDPERYADVLASMNLFGQVQYTGLSQSQSAFYQMQANYSFGNPCTYSPEVLRRIDVSVAQCESVLDKVIANGLAAYMRAGSALADDYIRGRRELSVEEINNFSISVSVLSAFVLNAIVTWGNEFIERAYALQSRTIFLAAVLAVGTLLLHVLLVECLLEGVLKREIGFIGKVYRHMFPEALLTREKVVVQELINGGLLTSSS